MEDKGIADIMQRVYDMKVKQFPTRMRHIAERSLPQYTDLLEIRNKDSKSCNISSCGPESFSKLQELADLLSELRDKLQSGIPLEHELDSDMSDANTTDEDFDLSGIKGIKDKLMSYWYFSQKLSSRGRTALNSESIGNYKAFLGYLKNQTALQNVRNVGGNTFTELCEFLQKTKAYAETVKAMTDEEAFYELHILKDFSFLNDSQIQKVAAFYKQYHHFPMFYIAKCFLTESSSLYVKIYAAARGINGECESRESLSAKYDLTTERVRQLLLIPPFVADSFFQIKELWTAYRMNQQVYLTADNTNYREVIEQENVELSFYAFCCIYRLFDNRYEMVEFSTIGNRYSTSSSDRFSYSYNAAFNCFHFYEVLNAIRTDFKINQKREIEIKAPIESYLSNPSFWDKHIVADGLKAGLKTLLSVILNDIFGSDITVKSGKIQADANALNLTQIIYEYMVKHGPVMHLDQIFKLLKKDYPDYKYTESSQLRPTMANKEYFVPLGKKSTYCLRSALPEDAEADMNVVSIAKRYIANAGKPVPVLELCQHIMQLRPDLTSLNSVQSTIDLSIAACFVTFKNGLIGLKNVSYPAEYEVQDRTRPKNTFETRLAEFKNFVTTKGRFPSDKGDENEQSLHRWFYHARMKSNNKDLHSKLTAVLEEFDKAKYPRTQSEMRFLDNCNLVRSFVLEHKRLLKLEDNNLLYDWFNTLLNHRVVVKDYRLAYWNDLIKFLAEQGCDPRI